jgi:hypothetical protein
MSANLSSCQVLRVALPDATSNTIMISDFAAQGCTIRSITLEVTTGGANVTVQDGNATNLLSAANAPTNVVGGFELALTATAANLSLLGADSIVINPTGASVLAVNIFFGDVSPTTITVS